MAPSQFDARGYSVLLDLIERLREPAARRALEIAKLFDRNRRFGVSPHVD